MIFIPKLLLRLLWFFRRTAALFRQIRTFPQLFRFCSDLGNSGIRQIVRNSMLTGRWWEGRILINLCGNNNVRNCDLLQSDFFARCITVLGVAKGFFRRVWYSVVKLGKRWGPETLWFFTLKKHTTKSHLQALVLGLVRSDISGHEKVAGHPNGALYFHESQEHAIFSILHKSPNCRRFLDNLYQIPFSGCSALHESRRQSLPYPYSPLRAPAFFRISRNRVQANKIHISIRVLGWILCKGSDSGA